MLCSPLVVESKKVQCIIWVSDDVIVGYSFRLKNKEVKVRRMNDPTLLGVDLASSFNREEGALKDEPDTLPPQPEDAMVFLNSCHKMIVRKN